MEKTSDDEMAQACADAIKPLAQGVVRAVVERPAFSHLLRECNRALAVLRAAPVGDLTALDKAEQILRDALAPASK